MDPTAKAHAIMADTAQQLVSPARISNVTALGASNRLDVVNYPAKLNGFVDSRANLGTGTWTLGVTNFSSTTYDPNDLCPRLRPAAVLPVAFSLRLDLAVASSA